MAINNFNISKQKNDDVILKLPSYKWLVLKTDTLSCRENKTKILYNKQNVLHTTHSWSFTAIMLIYHGTVWSLQMMQQTVA